MKNPKWSKAFIDKCRAVKSKRAKTVIEHILKHGFITTQELKNTYGYNHPSRAARDVRENGIPLETFRLKGSDGRNIGAYRFGAPRKARFSKLSGRTAFSKKLKQKLIEADGAKFSFTWNNFRKTNYKSTTGFLWRWPEMTQKTWMT